MFPIEIDYDAVVADDSAMEARIEQEILDRFNGYDQMVRISEAELIEERGMTVAEAIAYLRTLKEEE